MAELGQSLTVSVGDGHRLEPTTARQFMLWNWAFYQRFGRDMDVNWTLRGPAQQIALLEKYYYRSSSGSMFWDGSWWRKKGSVTVAKPGTSRHERGFAADVQSFMWSVSRVQAQWARDTAALYGFKFNVAGEDWHVDRVLTMRITSGNQRALGGSALSTPSPVSPTAPSIPAPTGPTQEELDYMAATKGAAIVRDYVTEKAGTVRTALIFPDGSAKKLSRFDDVNGAVFAHAKVYGIPKDNDDQNLSDREKYTQLTSGQWVAFWTAYTGRKVGFDKDGV